MYTNSETSLFFSSLLNPLLYVIAKMNRKNKGTLEKKKNMPASIILSTLASLIPFICKRSFLGEYATDSTVQRPASLSFFTSRAAMPDALI